VFLWFLLLSLRECFSRSFLRIDLGILEFVICNLIIAPFFSRSFLRIDLGILEFVILNLIIIHCPLSIVNCQLVFVICFFTNF